MAPAHVKLAAISLAVVSVVFFTRAATEWPRLEADSAAEAAARSARRGAVILLIVSLLLLGGLWELAEPLGWDRDRALWVGFGAFLAVMTMR